ncbi:hypothetical protein F2Q70_00017227 [Brassica cretica]|uniref:Uncharacterized protein n=2 Tax=Brassica cretica TaxID=69181 RepID=A0A3N6R2D7_BRACR|nr:hypothetical protein F2Q70_00017227 [Brassica cretica]KAF2608508.1 hypothetical protein F2Q68_00045766 [Brassica cretica]KAF3516664.1 hypothetical protein DY000_02062842 [Brassica cretica]
MKASTRRIHARRRRQSKHIMVCRVVYGSRMWPTILGWYWFCGAVAYAWLDMETTKKIESCHAYMSFM